jgi:adenylate cyclase
MPLINPDAFGPEPTLTAVEATEKAGVDLELARRFTLAVGLPAFDENEIAFSERDVEMLKVIRELFSTGIPPEQFVAVARVAGQAFSRIADIESRIFVSHVVDPLKDKLPEGDLEDTLKPLVDHHLDLLKFGFDYLHRRHLDVALRGLAEAGSPQETESIAVGFVDLVDFARIADELQSGELYELVDHFERVVIEICSGESVRLVKMIGDAAMVVSSETRRVLRAASLILTAVENDDLLPQARAGLDYGDAVPMGGDYFGRPVNVAARITGFARPGTTVVSSSLLDELGDEVQVSRIGNQRLKGVGRISLFKVNDVVGGSAG